MVNIQIEADKMFVDIDSSLYSDNVISKVCYWLTDGYIVFRKNIAENVHRLIIKPKNREISEAHFEDLEHMVSRSLADFKLREIVLKETKDIRNILYIKAFANNDDFEDYNLDF